MAESIRQSIAQEITKLKSQHKADDNSTPAKTIIIDDNAQQQTTPQMEAFAKFFAAEQAKYNAAPRKGSKEAERQDIIDECVLMWKLFLAFIGTNSSGIRVLILADLTEGWLDFISTTDSQRKRDKLESLFSATIR